MPRRMTMEEALKLPPLYNKRAEAQWEIITDHIDPRQKQVIDFGAGYGDIASRFVADGARFCIAVEQDKDICKALNRRLPRFPTSYVWCDTIETAIDLFSSDSDDDYFDIAVCFSVLPYLDDPDALLQWMSDRAGVSLVECQYEGDGPGPDGLNREAMREWLREYWDYVSVIGSTRVDYRNMDRDIWLCH